MVTTIKRIGSRVEASTTFLGADSPPGGSTSWVRLTESLAVQITGDASLVTATVERSTSANGGNACAVGDDLTGDLTDQGIAEGYTEPGVAWWRVTVSAIADGDALVVVSGKGV